MTPEMIAAMVVGFLTPYFAKAGEAIATKIGESVWQNITKLYQSTRARMKDNSPTEQKVQNILQYNLGNGTQIGNAGTVIIGKS
jgi:hypothetical protein